MQRPIIQLLPLVVEDASDRITATYYVGSDALTIDDDTPFMVSGSADIYTGTLTDAQISAIAGQTLMGVDVLNDNATNNINALASKNTNIVLSGRTLYKDGNWNTICLPFNVTIADSPLAGATVMKLKSSESNLTGGKLTLNFEDETTTMTAGTPYIIKWASGDNIVNPVFTGVTIDKTMHDVATSDGKVTFKGNYDYQLFNAENKSILFLGVGKNDQDQDVSTLYYPQSGAKIGACRAYFEITDGTSVRAFNLNFGDEEETQGIESLTLAGWHGACPYSGEGSIYNLNGVKVEKPVRKGLYIQNSKKVVVP